MRKKLLELGIKLSGQRFIVRKNQGRPLYAGDDIGHRERFSRPGRPLQHLLFFTGRKTVYQSIDCLRLITHGMKGRYQLKSPFIVHARPRFPLFSAYPEPRPSTSAG